jgi:hypothetical protein
LNIWQKFDVNDIYWTNPLEDDDETGEEWEDENRVVFYIGDYDGEDERFEFRNDYLSEKTSRNLMMGLPFIMVGPYKSLDRLKNMGFKTFEMIIDESYDMEPDPLQRFEMIKNEIIKISKLSVDEMESIHKELYPILIHNRNNIKNIQDNNAKKIQSLWK